MPRTKPTKTRKAVAKRFKVTATGKIKRARSGKRHLLQHKSPKQKRRLGSSAILSDSDRDRIILNLPFSNRK